eukprot:gene17207-biopygen11918
MVRAPTLPPGSAALGLGPSAARTLQRSDGIGDVRRRPRRRACSAALGICRRGCGGTAAEGACSAALGTCGATLGSSASREARSAAIGGCGWTAVSAAQKVSACTNRNRSELTAGTSYTPPAPPSYSSAKPSSNPPSYPSPNPSAFPSHARLNCRVSRMRSRGLR